MCYLVNAVSQESLVIAHPSHHAHAQQRMASGPGWLHLGWGPGGEAVRFWSLMSTLEGVEPFLILA